MPDPDPVEPPEHETRPTAAPPFMARAASAWGTGWPNCQGSKQVRVVGGGVAVNCRSEIAPLMKWALDATRATGYVLKQDQTGAFVCRPIGGTSTPSNHSWGLAVDLNWRENPFTHDANAPRTITPDVVRIWKQVGFSWGGDWSGKKDFMHMEFNGSPAEAARRVAALTATPKPPPPPPPLSPITVIAYPEDHMRSLSFTMPLDADGNGWRDIEADPAKIVSFVVNAANPPEHHYGEGVDVSRLDVAGKTRVVVVNGHPKGAVGLTVWVVDSASSP